MRRNYSTEFKRKVITDYLNEDGGYRYLGHRYQIDHTLVRRWVRSYKIHGWKGIERKQKKYTTKFKLNVIQYTKEHNFSAQEASYRFNLGLHSTVTNWIQQYDEGGISSLSEKKEAGHLA